MTSRGPGLPMSTRMSGSDAAMMALSALAMALITSVVTCFLVYQASLGSTPPISLHARLVAVYSTSGLVEVSTKSSYYLGPFSDLFTRLYMSYFWAFLILASILALTSTYPFLMKVYSQLPVLMYRVGVGPVTIALRTFSIALLGGLAVTIQPLLSYIAVVERYGLSRYISRGFAATIPVLGVVLLLLPGIASLIYLVSGRFDASLLTSIVVSVTSYELVLAGYWVMALVVIVLVVVMALYLVAHNRWHGVRRS